MTSSCPQDRTVAALDEVWASMTDLLVSLDESEWSVDTPLPGWDVQDNVSHIVGTEAMLLGVETPDVEVDRHRLTHVRNDIGAFNEAWVEHLRTKQPNEVLSLFTEYTGARLAALSQMSTDEWNAESFTPAGKSTYGRFMQIRVFDCWLHEQDIRDAVGRPGHEWGLAVEVTLDEMETAMGFVVGKRSDLAVGCSVSFELTHERAVIRTVNVEVGERASVVESLSSEPTVRIRLPIGTMTRLCAGRIEPATVRSSIEISGDLESGARLVERLAYTI